MSTTLTTLLTVKCPANGSIMSPLITTLAISPVCPNTGLTDVCDVAITCGPDDDTGIHISETAANAVLTDLTVQSWWRPTVNAIGGVRTPKISLTDGELIWCTVTSTTTTGNSVDLVSAFTCPNPPLVNESSGNLLTGLGVYTNIPV